MNPKTKYSNILSLCRSRGFLFPSSEIYGGLNSCWDYGPLGVQLKNKLKKEWWTNMTQRRQVRGLDASIFMHPKTWEASGHVEGFTDPLSDCKDCKHRFRPEGTARSCPKCGSKNITAVRKFNLMFKSFMGPVEEEGSLVYLRPETAQGIYVNFLNVQQSMRLKIPFGIAQIGKAFRNEITPSHSIFRTREFEQMEMQFFVSPDKTDYWFEYWKEERKKQLASLGLSSLFFKPHSKEELAHYAKKAQDIEFEFPWGRQELEGLHHRGDFDLSQHQKFSGKKLQYFCPEKNQSYIPHVIECSIGVDRLFLAILCSAYTEEKIKEDTRIVLKLKSHLAPVELAILPLSKKAQIMEKTEKLAEDLQKDFFIEHDSSGSIGKRYRRQDEIGTPFCITFDFDSLEDGQVTIRYRDSMEQKRISLSAVRTFLKENL